MQPPSESSSKKSFKGRMAGADVGDMFRKLREDASIRIRKEKRSDRMAQRRKENTPGGQGDEDTEGSGALATDVAAGGESIAPHDMQQPSSTLATTNTSDNNKTSSHSSTSFAGDGPIPKDTIVLNHKIQLLQSSDLPDRIEAALYFRRILAGDFNPPIDYFLSTGVVFPALVSFLTNSPSSVKLQVEAAWSITNIACSTNTTHVQTLLDLGCVESLLRVLHESATTQLVDQALWGLCNILSHKSVCDHLMATQQNAIIGVVLHKIGLICPPVVACNCYSQLGPLSIGPALARCTCLQQLNNSTSGAHSSSSSSRGIGTGTGSPVPLPPSTFVSSSASSSSSISPPPVPSAAYVAVTTRFEARTLPALSTAKHVSVLCGHLCRASGPSLGLVFYHCIIRALADLFDTSDDEICADICESLQLLLYLRNDTVTTMIFDEGVLSRAVELLSCDTQTVVDAAGSLLAAAMCASSHASNLQLCAVLVLQSSSGKGMFEILLSILQASCAQLLQNREKVTKAMVICTALNRVLMLQLPKHYQLCVSNVELVRSLCALIKYGSHDLTVAASRCLTSLVLYRLPEGGLAISAYAAAASVAAAAAGSVSPLPPALAAATAAVVAAVGDMSGAMAGFGVMAHPQLAAQQQLTELLYVQHFYNHAAFELMELLGTADPYLLLDVLKCWIRILSLPTIAQSVAQPALFSLDNKVSLLLGCQTLPEILNVAEDLELRIQRLLQ